MVLLYFFFFKQKTAYEMRISDWSSDVCSSDLAAADGGAAYRRDDRLLGAEQPRRFLVEVFAGAGGGRRVQVALGEVGAGAEGLALRAQDDRAQVGIRVDVIESVGDRVDERIVEKVVRRTLDLDGRDHAVVGDVGIRELL